MLVDKNNMSIFIKEIISNYTEFIDYIQSDAFIISGAQPPLIYTNEMPDAQFLK